MDENELRELMIKKNKEFEQVYNQHQECDQQLQAYAHKSFLSEAEERQVRELKKKKLALKDKMYFLMAEFRKNLP